MQIWHYQPATGELIGPGTADPDPSENGGWLVPAFATDVAPPDHVPGGQVAVWAGEGWQLREIATPQPQPDVAVTEPASVARQHRNLLLAACDWTVLPDAPLSAEARAAWIEYRTALRAVPQQPGFPAAITWPAAPAAQA